MSDLSEELNGIAVMDKPVAQQTVESLPKLEQEQKVILPFEKTEEYYAEQLGEIPKKPVYSFFKRLFDIVASVFALIVLAIPMGIIAICVKLSSPGPVFYKQERLGLNGVRYNVIKYRTMFVNAEMNGAQWSQGENDPRIVPKLMWVRKTRADELPQFWQCLTGGERDIIETTKKNAGFSRVVGAYSISI